ncbi:MAG: phosphotransferase, partial [Ilumatobacteraceae bacterium]
MTEAASVPPMVDAKLGREIATAFGLGEDGLLEGPVARGEVGQVWKLTTPGGVFAVKEPFEPPSIDEVVDDAAYQDRVRAAGVPMPHVVRARDGRVVARVDRRHVRLYGWVDLLPADRSVDPAAVGAVIAAIHRVVHFGSNGVHPWYTDPVGEHRWDALVTELIDAGAPFANGLAAQRDELVALERLLVPPSVLQTCHRDLFADNVVATPTGELCVIDWEN